MNGNITASLILSGTPTSVFVVNVTGNVRLTGSSTLGLSGGVTANHVLYNFTGSTGTIQTDVGNVINGTMLGLTYSFNLDGVFHGEIIGGGTSIGLFSQAKVNAGSLVKNTANVSATNDSNPGNNSSSATITLQ